MTIKIRPFVKRFYLISACLFSTSYANTLPIDVDDVFEKSPIAREQISVWVAPVGAGEPIIDWQSDVLRSPASVTKALTTGVGLLLLGENYQWRTEFSTDGVIANGELNGNLYVKGYGNPYFVEEELRDMIMELQLLGIFQINGDIILDNSYFVHHADTPNVFDGEGSQPYNALPNALSINFRTATISLDTDADGVHIDTNPKMSHFKVDNHMTLNRKPCRRGSGFTPKFNVGPQGKTLIATGTMSRKCPHKEELRVLGDAGDLFYAYFKREWLASGGTLDGSWLYGQVSNRGKLLYTAKSKPLYEQIQAMNKFSNNIMTRQLFLTIGAERTKPPGTVKKSRSVVIQQLEKMGINTKGMYLDNGSGLSRQTRITAQQMGQYLLAIQSSAKVAYFEDSLSIAGIDGTLKHRLRNTELVGNLIGKTGTLKNVKAQAGYLTAQSGVKFAYVMFIASEKKAKATILIDKLSKWIYNNN